MRCLLALAALLAGSACQKSDPAKTSGPANCARVAESLATFELGSAVTPDKRAPVVAKHRAACESTQTTAAEASCLAGAKDTWAARACLPRMFPPPSANGAAAGCAVVADRMREAVMAEVGSAGSEAAGAVEQMLPMVRRSCEEDAWPAAVLDCIGRTKAGDMRAFQTCMNQLPKDQQEKLALRLMAQQQGTEETPSGAPPAQGSGAAPAQGSGAQPPAKGSGAAPGSGAPPSKW